MALFDPLLKKKQTKSATTSQRTESKGGLFSSVIEREPQQTQQQGEAIQSTPPGVEPARISPSFQKKQENRKNLIKIAEKQNQQSLTPEAREQEVDRLLQPAVERLKTQSENFGVQIDDKKAKEVILQTADVPEPADPRTEQGIMSKDPGKEKGLFSQTIDLLGPAEEGQIPGPPGTSFVPGIDKTAVSETELERRFKEGFVEKTPTLVGGIQESASRMLEEINEEAQKGFSGELKERLERGVGRIGAFFTGGESKDVREKVFGDIPHVFPKASDSLSEKANKNFQLGRNLAVASAIEEQNKEQPNEVGQFVEELGGLGASMAISTIGGALGSLAGPAGTLAGAGATSASMEGGIAVDRARQNLKKSDEKAFRELAKNDEFLNSIALSVGIPVGVLDALPISRVLRRLPGGRKISKALSKNITDSILSRALRKTGSISAQSVLEGSTEGTQEIIANAVARTYDENQELFEGVDKATLLGLVGGGIAETTAAGIETTAKGVKKARDRTKQLADQVGGERGFINVGELVGQDVANKAQQAETVQEFEKTLTDKEQRKISEVNRSVENVYEQAKQTENARTQLFESFDLEIQRKMVESDSAVSFDGKLTNEQASEIQDKTDLSPKQFYKVARPQEVQQQVEENFETVEKTELNFDESGNVTGNGVAQERTTAGGRNVKSVYVRDNEGGVQRIDFSSREGYQTQIERYQVDRETGESQIQEQSTVQKVQQKLQGVTEQGFDVDTSSASQVARFFATDAQRMDNTQLVKPTEQARPGTLRGEGITEATPGEAVQRGFRSGKKIGKEQLKTQQQKTQFLQNLRKQITQRINSTYKAQQKASDAINDLIEERSTRAIDSVVKEAREAGINVDETVVEKMEIGLANRLLDRFRGNTELIKQRLRDKGVSEATIEKARIEDTYPLDETVKIKREESGRISATISKKYLAEIRNSFKGEKEAKKWIGRTKKGLRDTKNMLGQLVVPQEFFRRIGLKELIYDRARQGELNAEQKFKDELKVEIDDAFNEISPQGIAKLRRPVDRLLETLRLKTDPVKQSRRNVLRYFAGRRGRKQDMRDAGVKPVEWSDLSAREKRVVKKWRVINDKYKDEIFDLAHKHGKDIMPITGDYFPLYTRDELTVVGEGASVDDGTGILRKDPFFRSLLETEEQVPYSVYEEDAYKQAITWAQGAARFTEVGKRTVPLKFLIDSDEFVEIVGEDVRKHIRDNWFAQITTPGKSQQPGSGWFSAFKKTTYYSLIGGIFGSVPTVLKQGISYFDIAITHRVLRGPEGRVGKEETAPWAEKMTKPNVTERVPFIGMDSASSVADKALLGGITIADQGFAGGAMSKMLTSEVRKRTKKGEKLTPKKLRRILRDVADEIDLAFGGATPAQKPPIYQSQLGEAMLTLMSTINSQFQFYIKNLEVGIADSDAKHIASVLTAFFFAAYAEQAITRMDLGFEDEEQFWKEMMYATGGKAPIMGSVLFAFETGDALQPSAMLANISQVFKNGPTAWELAHLLGTPRQIRDYVEGIGAIRSGMVEVNNTEIPVEGFGEQVRAFIGGKYGPLAAQSTFTYRDRFKIKNSDDILSEDEKQEFFSDVNEALKKNVINEEKAERLKNTLRRNQNKIKAQNIYDEFKNATPEQQRKATKDLDKGVLDELDKIIEDNRKERMMDLYKELKDEPAEVQRENTKDLSEKELEVLDEIIEKDRENKKQRVNLLNDMRNKTVDDEKDIFDRVSDYANAMNVDFMQAWELTFEGEVIRRTDAGQIIVERADEAYTQNIKEELGAKPGQELDHVMPLQLGGTNAKDNLELVDAEVHEKYTRVGNHLRRMAIGEVITMEKARQIMRDFRKGNLEEEEIYDMTEL